jgi:FlaG/FlaF family flagellin (archaellin)
VNLLSRLSPSNLAAISASSSEAAATSPTALILAVGITVALGATIFASLHRMITHD